MWKESYDVKRIKKTGKLKQQYGCNEHCVRSVRIRSSSGPYFPAFGLNTDQNNYEYGHFLLTEVFLFIVKERNIEIESTTRILHSSRTIRLQTFCTLTVSNTYLMHHLF